MKLKALVFAVVAISVAGPLVSQIVDPGMSWSSGGAFVGTACGGFTCTPYQTAVTPGDIVTLQVRGTYLRAYAIGISSSATQCLAIPGVHHSLVLDFPVTIAQSGILVQGDPVLLCPGGRVVFTFAFPFMSSGTSFSIQAAAEYPDGTPALTSAITVTVN